MIDNRMKTARKPKDIWYAWYPSDYASKTAHLSLLEHGAYRVLLDHYYQVDGKVLANATPLLRVCRAFDAAEQAAVKAVLVEFFVERDGYYHHERADAELEKRRELKEKRAAAGSKGGNQKALASAKQKPPHLHLQNKEDSEARASGTDVPTLKVNGHGVPEKELDPVIELVAPEPPPRVPRGRPQLELIETPIDPSADVWTYCLPMLMRTGRREDQARTFLGKLCKNYEAADVLDAFETAEAKAAPNPGAYAAGILTRKSKKVLNGNGQFGKGRAVIDNHPRGNFAAIGDRLRASGEGRTAFDA